ncbi:hypothetical protein JXA47_09700 [Candidatus Sumerlaeota bacterium]|nr:hypothetical protein [Candidatus Sumerlaeota bacterium]
MIRVSICLLTLAASSAWAQPDPVAAYFDMMDAIRTEAWGRSVVTPPAERERVRAYLQQSWGEIEPQMQSAIMQLPSIWEAMRTRWFQISEAERAALRDQWRLQLLEPTQIVPPLAQTQTYRANDGSLTFEYPADWLGDETTAEGSYFLFLRPPGYSATWEQAFNPATSPPGLLLAVLPMDDEIRASGSCLAAARLVARNALTPSLPDAREIDAVDLGGEGAILTCVSGNTAPTQGWFHWIIVAPFGPDRYIAVRMGGAIAQAESLVPALCHVLNTVDVNPPGVAGTSEGNLAVDVAVGQISNQVMGESWFEFANPDLDLYYE